MIRNPRFRSYLSILLTFCLLSMSLWSYSAEATADDLATSEIAYVSPSGLDLPDHSPTTDKTCNHGCHAQSHLAGLQRGDEAIFFSISLEPVLPSELAAIHIPAQPNEGPFRPPRPTFQA